MNYNRRALSKCVARFSCLLAVFIITLSIQLTTFVPYRNTYISLLPPDLLQHILSIERNSLKKECPIEIKGGKSTAAAAAAAALKGIQTYFINN